MKEVKKIVKYLGIFVVCLIVFDVLFGFVMDRLWNNMPDTVSQTAKANTFLNKVEADVIVLGSSRAAHHYVSSILEDSLGMSVYNCGHEGMDLIYCDAVLDAIINRHTPKLVILDMSEDYLKGSTQGRLHVLTPYVKINPYISTIMKELKGTSSDALRLCNMYRYNDKLLNMFSAFSSEKDVLNGYTPLFGASQMIEIMPNPATLITEEEVNDFEKSHLLHLINTCEANGVILYITDSPRYNIVYENLAFTRSLCEGHSVGFLDYSEMLINRPEVFLDRGHLLNEGAIEFSKTLAGEISRRLSDID